MSNKLILIAMAVCMGASMHVAFGESEEQPAATSSWRDWAASYLSAARKKAGQAAETVKIGSGALWSATKEGATQVAEAVGVRRGIAEKGTDIVSAEDKTRDIISDLASSTESFNRQRNVALVMNKPFSVFEDTIQKILLYYNYKHITKQVAVDRIKDIISIKLSDSVTYPTVQSKIDALSKNVFMIYRNDDDDLILQASNELKEQITQVKRYETGQAKVETQIESAGPESRKRSDESWDEFVYRTTTDDWKALQRREQKKVKGSPAER